jgi:hypothetical protein
MDIWVVSTCLFWTMLQWLGDFRLLQESLSHDTHYCIVVIQYFVIFSWCSINSVSARSTFVLLAIMSSTDYLHKEHVSEQIKEGSSVALGENFELLI